MIYVIVQEGVYRHKVGGAFTSLEKAIHGARKMKEREPDEYHDWVVLEGTFLDDHGEMIEVYRTPKDGASPVQRVARQQAETAAAHANKTE